MKRPASGEQQDEQAGKAVVKPQAAAAAGVDLPQALDLCPTRTEQELGESARAIIDKARANLEAMGG